MRSDFSSSTTVYPNVGEPSIFFSGTLLLVALYSAYPNVGELTLLLSVLRIIHTRTKSQNSPEELTGQRAGLVSSRNNESIE